ncbi:MAG: DNA recombination protein RmuC [Terracidiphilus sp.]|jgi:DNA recombination protein RmuC
MQTLIAGIAAAFVGIILGFWLRAASTRGEKAQLERRALELAGELTGVRGEVAEKDREILRLSRLDSQLETDLANERGNGERLTQQFKVLANEILKDNSKTFTEQNKESLSHLLNPLTRDLNEFRVKVEEVKAESLVGRTELSAQLKGLESLNKRLSDEAHNLATALRRDTKAQGNWGEIILLDILENSGLRKGEHFTFQQSFIEEAQGDAPGQRRQTDVVVRLPGGRHLIIDSKVSINAYNDFLKAVNDEERKAALKRHIASVRSHYVELAERNYQRLSGIQSPDFVVMFVPIEPAFMLAMQEDDGLWLDAYQKGVLLAGPTTVLFVVRIVENLWSQEQQVRNVKDVMKRGALLYDKFVGFVADMEKIGKSLQGTKEVYEDAMDKLKKADGNLIGQVEKLKKLGVRSSKSLPRNLLDSEGVEEPALAPAAEAEENDEA